MYLQKPTLAIFASSLFLISFLFYDATAESVPEWIKNTALWYGEGAISETEFLNAIKFLIENEIIILDFEESGFNGLIQESTEKTGSADVIIPSGNGQIENIGFYIPLNLEIKKGTTVVWVNNDDVGHTVQSQDDEGKVIGLFNSPLLKTGERFPYTFEDPGIFHYFCTIHPWRVGVITVR